MSAVGNAAAGIALVAGGAALAVLAVVRTVVVGRRVARADPPTFEILDRRDRSIGMVVRLTGVVGYLVLAVAVGALAPSTDGAPAPAAAGAGLLTVVVLIAMERWWPTPRGLHRRAVLTRRRTGRYLSAAGCVLAGAAIVLLVVEMARALQVPGALPTGPAVATAVGVVAAAAAAWVGIRAVVNRSAVAGLPASVDDSLRRADVDRYVRLVGVAAAAAAACLSEIPAGVGGSDSGRTLAWLLLAMLVLAYRSRPVAPARAVHVRRVRRVHQ